MVRETVHRRDPAELFCEYDKPSFFQLTIVAYYAILKALELQM